MTSHYPLQRLEDRVVADWGHELGDRVAMDIFYAETFPQAYVRAWARLATPAE